MFRLYKNHALVPWGFCYKQQEMCKKVRANDYLCEKINTQMLMKHIRIPLFVWFSIVLLIAVAPVSLSAQESFIQKIEKNKSVSGIKSLDTSRFPEKYVMYLTQPLDHRHPEKGSFRQQTEFIIWGSNGPMPISRPVSCLPGVFRYGNPQNRVHVTEKPLQLMKDVVQICEPGGRILDPFAGAGTTILAAAQQGYQAVGIEVTDAYFQLGTERVREALKEEVDVQ